MTETKRCTKCGKDLPLEEFCKHRASPDGLDYWCRSCKRAADTRLSHTATTPAAMPSRWVSLTCETCGKEFRYRRGEIESRKRRGMALPRFCSRTCANWALNHPSKVQA